MTELLLLFFLFNFVVAQRECGVSHSTGVGVRIKEDAPTDTEFGEFPWMAAVLAEEKPRQPLVYQCGGSLIHSQIVLTAAHCVRKNHPYSIRVGEWDTRSRNELFPHQNRLVTAVIIHPHYSATKHSNDVAVLILDRPVEIAANVDTVCLPTQDQVLEETTICYASGWGKNSTGIGGRFHTILKKVDLPIVSQDTCQEQLRTTRLGSRFKLHRSFICAGGEAGKDTCEGDGGSPLVCRIPDRPDRFFQAGIVSWGIGCGQDQIPGVYASVAPVVNWLYEQIDKVGQSH